MVNSNAGCGLWLERFAFSAEAQRAYISACYLYLSASLYFRSIIKEIGGNNSIGADRSAGAGVFILPTAG